MSVDEQIPFMLGMFTVSASPAFPALVLDDEALVPLHAVAPLAARLGMALTGTESLFGLLQNWDHNFRALSATVMALDDAELGRFYRSAFSALEFFEADTPIPAPRQIFTEVTTLAGEPMFVARLPSTVGGPKARIPLPSTGSLVAEAKIGAVIGRPVHGGDETNAAAAIAGFMTITDVTRIDALHGPHGADWLAAKSGPGFMPTGPWFVPAPFAGDMTDVAMAIAFNGETRVETTTKDLRWSFARQIAELSARCQLFPGDLVCSGVVLDDWSSRLPVLGDGDIIETAIYGLGRQTTNSQKIVRH